MVRAQARLLDHLNIPDVLCVLGGSMGGMQVLEWAATYKDRVFSAVPIACAARHSSQNIAFHEVGRNLQDREKITFGFDADFQVESYLRHQGLSFVDRFDANSYLYITRAMDYFDLAADHGARNVEIG